MARNSTRVSAWRYKVLKLTVSAGRYPSNGAKLPPMDDARIVRRKLGCNKVKHAVVKQSVHGPIDDLWLTLPGQRFIEASKIAPFFQYGSVAPTRWSSAGSSVRRLKNVLPVTWRSAERPIANKVCAELSFSKTFLSPAGATTAQFQDVLARMRKIWD